MEALLHLIPSGTGGHPFHLSVAAADEDHQHEGEQRHHIGHHVNLIQKGEVGQIGQLISIGLLQKHQSQQHRDWNSGPGILFISPNLEHQQHHRHHHQQRQHQPPERGPG